MQPQQVWHATVAIVVLMAISIVIVKKKVVVVVVIMVVVVGSGYVRDGTFLWHRKGRNAVNTSIRGVSMVPVHRRIILAFFAATCLEH